MTQTLNPAPTQMDELHAQALATDLLRSRVLEDDDRLLGVLLERPDALNTYLSAPAVRNELHTRAAEMNRNRRAILNWASDGALKHLMNTASAQELADSGLSVRALRNELYRRHASPCAQTCTPDKCYYEPEDPSPYPVVRGLPAVSSPEGY